MQIWMLFMLIPLAAIVLGSPLGQALAARIRAPAQPPNEELPAKTEERIRILEGEVDRLGREVEDLAEQNRFLTGLVEETTPEIPARGDLDLPR